MFGSRSLSIVLSLLLREELVCELQTCHPLGNDCSAMTARVVRSGTKGIPIPCDGPEDVAGHVACASVPDAGSFLSWAMFFAACEQQG